MRDHHRFIAVLTAVCVAVSPMASLALTAAASGTTESDSSDAASSFAASISPEAYDAQALLSDSEADSDADANPDDSGADEEEEITYETFEINDMEDFEAFVAGCHVDTWSADKYVVLNVDLDFGGEEFEPIELFGGLFDGQNHTLSGIVITGYVDETGIFGTIAEGGIVANLNVEGSIEPTGWQDILGGLVGNNYGTISNCSFSGYINADSEAGGIAAYNAESGIIIGCSTSGSILANSGVGGIVGYNEGTVASCENGMEINTAYQDTSTSLDEISETLDTILQSESIFNTGELTDDSDIGGIAGFSSGVITSCTNQATVGYEHVGYNVGGIVGRSSGYVSGCINYGQVYGRKDVGGIAGQMQPYLNVSFTEETLDELETELDILGDMVQDLLDDMEGSSDTLSNHLTNINGLVDIAIDAVAEIADDAEATVDDASEQLNAAGDKIRLALNIFSSVGDSLDDYLDELLDSVNGVESGISGYLSGISSSVAELLSQLESSLSFDTSSFSLDSLDSYSSEVEQLQSLLESLKSSAGSGTDDEEEEEEEEGNSSDTDGTEGDDTSDSTESEEDDSSDTGGSEEEDTSDSTGSGEGDTSDVTGTEGDSSDTTQTGDALDTDGTESNDAASGSNPQADDAGDSGAGTSDNDAGTGGDDTGSGDSNSDSDGGSINGTDGSSGSGEGGSDSSSSGSSDSNGDSSGSDSGSTDTTGSSSGSSGSTDISGNGDTDTSGDSTGGSGDGGTTTTDAASADTTAMMSYPGTVFVVQTAVSANIGDDGGSDGNSDDNTDGGDDSDVDDDMSGVGTGDGGSGSGSADNGNGTNGGINDNGADGDGSTAASEDDSDDDGGGDSESGESGETGFDTESGTTGDVTGGTDDGDVDADGSDETDSDADDGTTDDTAGDTDSGTTDDTTGDTEDGTTDDSAGGTDNGTTDDSTGDMDTDTSEDTSDSESSISDILTSIQQYLSDELDLEELQSRLEGLSSSEYSALQSLLGTDTLSSLLSGVQDDVTSMQESLSEVMSAIDGVSDSALDLSDLSSSVSSALDVLEDSPDIMTSISTAMDVLASIDLQLNGVSDTTRNNADILYSSLSQLMDEMENLNQDMSDSVSGTKSDLSAIADQFDRVLDVLIDSVESMLGIEEDEENSDDEEDGDSSDEDVVEDTSDEDIENTYQGRTTGCVNYGDVDADIDVGGIVGMVDVEYSLDPELDVETSGSRTLDYIFQAKCIVDDCDNRGNITTRSNYAGGIAGRMEMGLITSSANYGTLDCSGNYIGGVVGYSAGTVRYSTAKCDISGGRYVGGIAGYGTTLLGNLSMVNVLEYEQYVGAIAGSASDIDAEEISGNYYYSTSLYGIDSVSYTGLAEGIAYTELTSKDAIPEEFSDLVLTFVADDEVVGVITLGYGESVAESELPEIPELEGFYGVWSRTDYSSIVSDETITAEYIRYVTLLSAGVKRENGLDAILVDGNFRADDALTLTAQETEDVELERWTITIPEDGAATHQIRYLLPDEEGDRIVHVYLIEDGVKTEIETSSFSDYITFEVEGNEVTFAVDNILSENGQRKVYIILAAAAAAAAVILILLLVRRRRRKRG